VIQFSEKDFEEFHQAFNHDVVGVLSRINYLVDMIENSGTHDPESLAKTYPYLKTSVKEGFAKIKRIDLLLKIFQHKPSTTTFCLKELIQSHWKELISGDSDATITLPHSIRMNSDVFLVNILLYEVIQNSIMHYSRKEPLELSVSYNSDTSELEIRDNGTGFDPALADRVTKPFRTLRSRSVDEFYSGMGLYFCRCIMQRLGGVFQIFSGSSGCTVKLAFSEK